MSGEQALLKKISYALFCVYCFSLNFDSWTLVEAGRFSVPKLFAGLYFLSVLASSRGNLSVVKSGIALRWLLLSFATVIFSGLIGYEEYGGDVVDLSIGLNVLLFWAMLRHLDDDSSVLMGGIVCYAFGVCLLAGLSMFGIGREVNSEGRVTMFGDNMNDLGLRATHAVIIFVSMVLGSQKSRATTKLALSALILPLLSLMLSTGSRVSFLSSAAGLAVLSFGFKSKSSVYKFLVLCVVIASIPFVIDYIETHEALVGRLTRTIRSGDLAKRDVIWSSLIPLAVDRPILGYGSNGYDLISRKLFRSDFRPSPHNVPLEIFLLGGVVAALFYFMFWLEVFRAAWRSYRRYGNVLAIALSVPVVGSLLSAQALEVKQVYLMAALMLASGHEAIGRRLP